MIRNNIRPWSIHLIELKSFDCQLCDQMSQWIVSIFLSISFFVVLCMCVCSTSGWTAPLCHRTEGQKHRTLRRMKGDSVFIEDTRMTSSRCQQKLLIFSTCCMWTVFIPCGILMCYYNIAYLSVRWKFLGKWKHLHLSWVLLGSIMCLLFESDFTRNCSCWMFCVVMVGRLC